MTTLWVPLEVSSLRSRAQEHLHEKTPGKDSGEIIPRKRILDVTFGNDILTAWRARAAGITMKTGCGSIDELLGKYGRLGLIGIAGNDSTLRTTLSLHLAVGFLANQSGNVSIIDSTGSFDVVKVLGIIQSRFPDDMASEEAETRHIAMLDQIQVSRVFDVEGLYQTVLDLEKRLSTTQDKARPEMLVIDDMSSIFTAEISKNTVHGYGQLSELCLKLRHIAAEHQIVVLLLNTLIKPQTDSNSPRSTEQLPSLGSSFADLLDTSLVLTGISQVNQGHLCRLQLVDDSAAASADSRADFLLLDGLHLRS